MDKQPPPESANVFLTKSFWLPLAGMIGSKITLAMQPWFEVTPEVEDSITIIITMSIIAIVRRVTKRRAYFVRPKEKG